MKYFVLRFTVCRVHRLLTPVETGCQLTLDSGSRSYGYPSTQDGVFVHSNSTDVRWTGGLPSEVLWDYLSLTLYQFLPTKYGDLKPL